MDTNPEGVGVLQYETDRGTCQLAEGCRFWMIDLAQGISAKPNISVVRVLFRVYCRKRKNIFLVILLSFKRSQEARASLNLLSGMHRYFIISND